jgi:hypothetical protein
MKLSANRECGHSSLNASSSVIMMSTVLPIQIDIYGRASNQGCGFFIAPCSLMDRTGHYGCSDGGSIPSEGTIINQNQSR